MDYNSIPFKNDVIDRLQKKDDRLKKKEDKLVAKGRKAQKEGKENKAYRILGRAADIQDKRIRKAEKNAGLEYEPRVRKRDARKWNKEFGL